MKKINVMNDIKPYKSMITGEMITSRSKHREHLKRYGCIEVGNDSSLRKGPQPLPDVNPQQRKEIIREQVMAMSDEKLKKAIKKDIDFIKWNSNYK